MEEITRADGHGEDGDGKVPLSIPDVGGKKLGTAMLMYAAAGWYVGPVTMRPGESLGKNPGGLLGAEWETKTSRDPEVIRGWFRKYGNKIKGIALHAGRSGVVIFDVDDPEMVPEPLAAELNGRYTGPFQSTRDNFPGRGHYVFALPEGFECGNSGAGFASGWGEIRGKNGVIIIEPTPHEKDHGRYKWLRTGPVQMIPDVLKDRLRPPGPGKGALNLDGLEDFMDEYDEGTETHVLQAVLDGFTKSTEHGTDRHPSCLIAAGKIARDAMRGRYPARAGFDALQALFEDATADRFIASEWGELLTSVVGGTLAKAAEEAALSEGWDPEDRDFWFPGTGDDESEEEPAAPGTPEVKPERTDIRLPDGFWKARPELAHIRTAAHSRAVGADAVFYGTLARLASMLPGDLKIDTGMMTPASLNLFVAMVAESGTGKSGSAGMAALLLPVPEIIAGEVEAEPLYRDRAPMGSGEGLAEAYMGTVDTVTGQTASGTDRTARVRKQVRYNASFYVDEGKTLTLIMNKREGSTLGQVIRTAWTGSVIGQQNGTVERTRIVRDYALGVLVGFQPCTALPMLDEADEGTPQRFVWCVAGDPAIPDEPPEDPGPLWEADTLAGLLGMDPFMQEDGLLGEGAVTTVTMCEELRVQLRADHLSRQRGGSDLSLFDSHRPLTMVKLSGLLAILARRTEITQEDWRLAATLWGTSCAVRDGLLEDRKRSAVREQSERNERRVAEAVAVQRATQDETAKLHRVAQTIRRRVEKGPCKWREISQAISSRDKKDGFDRRALKHALAQGWVQEGEEGTFSAGDS